MADADRVPVQRLPPAFWCLWSSSMISYLGDGMRFVALPLLAARLTQNPATFALVTAAGNLPWLFGVLVPGLTEWMDAARLMVALNVFRCCLAMLIVVVVTVHAVGIAWLAGFAAFLTAAQLVYDQSANRLLPRLLGTTQLVPGNARLSLGDTVVRVLAGPPLGAALFGIAAGLPLGIDAATFGIAAALLILPPLSGGNRAAVRADVKLSRTVLGRPRRPIGELTAGVRITARCPALRAQVVIMAVWNLFLGGIFGVLVLWATQTLGLSDAGYGLLALGSAAGGCAGALGAPAIRRVLGTGRTMQLSVLGVIVTFTAMGLVSEPLVAGALFAVNAGFTVIWSVIAVSIRQSITPAPLMARIQGVVQTFGKGFQPVGAVLGGVAAAAWGLRAPFLLASVCFAVVLPLLPALSDRHVTRAELQLRQEVSYS